MYNFVIFGTDWDLYTISYSEIENVSNARYISTPYNYRNSLFKLLYRIHHHQKLNSIINIPYKHIWNSEYFKSDFEDSGPICFIFFSSRYSYNKYGLVSYLRQKYPDSKMVCFFQDLIDINPDINIDNYRETFDLLISFDHAEALKYNILYHSLVFSEYKISSRFPKSDIYFLGQAKNRFNEIIATFEYLRNNDIICDFNIVGVSKNSRIYANEIKYIDKMSYEENLQHVISSRSILEIMQKGGSGYTQRICEAIAYNKKVITNNLQIKNAPFFNEKYISVFTDIYDMNISLLSEEFKNDIVNYNYLDQLSPKHFLTFIESKLIN